MKVISTIGYPVEIQNKIAGIYDFSFLASEPQVGFFLKDSEIKGFKLTKNNYFKEQGDIFREYYTYENENGIGQKGKVKSFSSVLTRANNSFITSEPVFIGDTLDGSTVISSVCYYEKAGWWNCVVQFGDLEAPNVLEQNNTFNQNIVDSLNAVKDSLDNLKGAFNTVNVGIPTQGWATPPSSLVWDQNIETAKASIDNSINILNGNIL